VRLGKLSEERDRSNDYDVWDSLGDEARNKAAWELVLQAALMQGKSLDELRFQRSLTKLIRKWR